ncbi:DUF4232 domain-containing protein [Kutzneria sp. NPDC052558]|uniref:DUF4232 domain-containing protein n=1 Tax=Kutzneria sp. NPDC052558 TaxID=3364121 RepID=UPI0037C72193
MRKVGLTLALLPVAGLMLAACTGGSTGDTPAAGSAPTTATSTAPATHTASTKITQASSPPPVKAQPACQPNGLTTEAAVASTTATTVIVQSAVKNTGPATCVIQGYPQVAITGLPPASGEWPRQQLTVTKVGPSSPVTLVPGDGAEVLLTFTRCPAGQESVRGPVLLLGVPDGGIEMTMADNSDFVACGNTVQAQAFQQHQP